MTCLLCGKDHPPGQHDFSGLGDAVIAHASHQFHNVFDGPREPIPAVQQIAVDLGKTRRNGALPPDQPESLPQEVNTQRAPYRANNPLVPLAEITEQMSKDLAQPPKRGPGRPRKVRDV